MKLVIRIALVVVLLVVIAAVAGFIMIDSIATAAVSKGAAVATQTDADCEQVDIKVFGSSAEIINLDIKNPDGAFRDKFDSFLKLGDGTAAVTVGSVMSDLIEIPKVELRNIEITLVGFEDGKKNYEVILESLKRFQGDTPPDETKSQKKIVIRELIIRNITVHYDFAKDPALDALPVSGTITIADDKPMVLTDVGSGGVPMSQITADIITDILVQVTANLAGNIGDHVLGLTGSLAETIGVDELKGTLEELGLDLNVSEQLEEYTEKIGEFLGDAGKGAGDLINEAGGVLGDVIGGDDE